MKKNFRLAIYPGTFDPVTNGHLDILKRASAIFDKVIVAIAENSSKKTIFSIPERLALLKKVVASNRFSCPIEVDSFKGLLVKHAQKRGAKTLVRGLRAVSDFEYEFQIALMNRHQASNVETLFLMPDEKFVYLSSSIVKEIARLNGDLKDFLPPPVIAAVRRKFGRQTA